MVWSYPIIVNLMGTPKRQRLAIVSNYYNLLPLLFLVSSLLRM